LDVGQHRLGVAGSVAHVVHLADDALGIDEERLPPRVVRVALVGAPDYVERFAQRALGVAQQPVREILLVDELLVFGRSVERDTEDRGTGLVVLGGSITEPLSFDRSAAGAGLRVPPEHDPLAQLVGHANDVAVLVG
jgi:hypothetical protein